MNDNDARKWRLQQLLRRNKDKIEKNQPHNALFIECVEALGDGTIVLSKKASKKIMYELEGAFPITFWGRIEWSKVQNKINVESPAEILKALENRLNIDTLFYIVWGYGDSPCLKANLDRIIHSIDAVTCVGGDQFLFCPEYGVVIEFYHEGEITIGFS